MILTPDVSLQLLIHTEFKLEIKVQKTFYITDTILNHILDALGSKIIEKLQINYF